MASTGLIATRPTKVGDVIKHEYLDKGYTRIDATVTVVDGMSVGAVLESTSVAGKYTLVAAATVANADGVLVDEKVYDDLAAGDHVLAVLVRGPSVVADKSLTFAADVDTDNEKQAAYSALEAAGIVVKAQV